MSDTRDAIVKRVVDALDADRDPAALVQDYFESDRAAVIEAARQTLEATGETAAVDRLEAAVDRELVEALRFPDETPGGLPVRLFMERRAVAKTATLVTALAAILALLLF